MQLLFKSSDLPAKRSCSLNVSTIPWTGIWTGLLTTSTDYFDCELKWPLDISKKVFTVPEEAS